MILVWVSLAGGFGALTRALVDRLVAVRWPAWWATLGINLAGSFAVGVAAGVLSAAAFAVVGTGFCGGFTTFSSFSADTVRLLRAECYGPALLYVALSVAVCIAFAALGWWIGTLLKN